MRIAQNYSELSRGIRAKVGAVMVTSSGLLIPGFNGTPKGRPNELEFVNEDGEYVTKPEVIHAELNCVLKAAREGVSCFGADVYITHSPCVQCAGMMVNAGVGRVFYKQVYKNTDGVDLLNSSGIFTSLLELE